MAALSSRRALLSLFPLLACAPAPAPEWARPRVDRPAERASAGAGPRQQETAPAEPSASPALSPAVASAAACRDQLGSGELSRVSCAGDRILVRSAIELHPARQVPTEPTRSVLASVGVLMRDWSGIQLIRIETYSNARVRDAEQARAEVRASQERADAVLRYLWRAEKVSAERMEAVGYGADSRFEGSSERWPTRIVIVQTRPSPSR